MQLAPNHIRVASPDGKHITELRFDGPVVISVLQAETVSSDTPEFDYELQDMLMDLLKNAARKLHGNLSTGLVMKELYNKGIGLRGQVSEAMVLAVGDALVEARLMPRDMREAFAGNLVRQRIVYGARKGLEGMVRDPNLPMIQALSDALLHGRETVTLGESHYTEAWKRVRQCLQEIVAKEGDCAMLSPDNLVTLELAGRANLDYITDQTAWALVDIAKKSEFAIRDAAKTAPGISEARARTLTALGSKTTQPQKQGFWKKLLG